METLFFTPKTIREFLNKHKEELSKYDELLIGLALSNFHKSAAVKEALIGFKIKSELFRTLPQKGKTNLAMVGLLFDHFKDTYTPIDIVIAFDPIKSLSPKTNHGVAYQLKRFRKHINGDATEPLIDYLNQDIRKKYAATNAKLILLPEHIQTIDWLKVRHSFKPESFPFTGVMFFVISDNLAWVGEIWPTAGMNSYPAKEMLAV
jgi:hypothetical protein